MPLITADQPVSNIHSPLTNTDPSVKKAIKNVEHSQPAIKGLPQWKPAATILREMLADRSRTIVCPGVYDGLTARLALNAGFDCLYMTGAGSTASVLGMPDLALMSMNEMHDNARMIASIASSNPNRIVPVIADADTGFGSPLNVSRTVANYITSNVAALHIEDQTQTKRCGHLKGKQLVGREEYLTRIRAAAVTRQNMGRDIVIIARTDCFQSLGVDEALARLKLAVEAGADVAFIEGIPDIETGKRMCAELYPTPVLANVVAGGYTPMFTKEQGEEMGASLIIHTTFALSPVYRAVKEAAEALKRDGKILETPGNGSIRDVFNVCGIQDCIDMDVNSGGKLFGAGPV